MGRFLNMKKVKEASKSIDLARDRLFKTPAQAGGNA